MNRLRKKFNKLVGAYLEGNANEQQLDIIDQYYDSFDTEPDVLDKAGEIEINIRRERMKAIIDGHLSAEEDPVIIQEHQPGIRPWKYIAIAASLLIVGASGFYFYQTQQSKLVENQKELATIVLPGGNKAVLTLANGKKISLTDAGNGQIAAEYGVTVNKTKDGNLIYNSSETDAGKLAYNTIQTPKGGQYQVTLPDGSKIWLNASSSLRYPVEFIGNERKVELTGEAYFEVTKNKAKPFRVYTDQEVVEVLGTHFNINAYKDELSTKTSLLEGSVQVTHIKSNNKAIIKPGQQSIVQNNSANQKITIKNIDIDEAVAWKNGYFMFDDEPLESILRKVSRWYDVDVEYKRPDQIKDISFSGTLSKYSDVGKVLDKLELSGAVHFKIEGRKIIVMAAQ